MFKETLFFLSIKLLIPILYFLILGMLRAEAINSWEIQRKQMR